MKPCITFLFLFALAALACNAPIEGLDPTPPILPTPIPNTASVATATRPVFVPTATIEGQGVVEPVADTVESPTITEPAGIANFTNLRMSDSATGASDITTFPAGSEAIFALWDYVNMTEASTMRRVWYYNGEAWLEREEVWDIDKYGRSGTVRDISIYDYEDGGLLSGEYRLELYLDDVLKANKNFKVEGATSSSTETQVVRVVDGKQLVLEDQQGTDHELATGQEIVELAWFPDGQHLLYVDKLPTDKNLDGYPFPRHEVWLVNITTNEQWLVGAATENLHTAMISPNGRYVSFIAGSNFGDACFIDRQLSVLILDEVYQRTALYKMDDFVGTPTNERYWFYPVDQGKWQSPTELAFHITGSCLTPSMNAHEADLKMRGIYHLDVAALTAQKVADPPSNWP